MRTRTGYVYKDPKTGFWYARVTYTDNTGRRKDVKHRADNKTNAHTLLKKLINTLDTGGHSAIEAEKVTFKDLCDYYEKHYAIPAQYANGRKVAGLRSVVSVKGYIKVFREHFGKRLLKSITYDDLRTYRANRLKTKTQQSEQRSLTTVNREMAYLRRILNIAERNGWITPNPFKLGDALIHAADEQRRERILTLEESQNLVNACIGARAHLRPIVIAGLDTGCRMREILTLRWRDIDRYEGIIIIQAFNTKTMRQRQVSITSRLSIELEKLWDASEKNADASVCANHCPQTFCIKSRARRRRFLVAKRVRGLRGAIHRRSIRSGKWEHNPRRKEVRYLLSVARTDNKQATQALAE